MKKNKDFKINKIYKFISYLLTIFLIIGDTYKTSGSFFIIWDNIGTVILTIIKLIGYSKLIQLLLFIINNYFINYRDRELKVKNKYLKKYIELFNKNPFKTSLITLLIGWSIYLIAFYPIVLSPDPANQIIQYLNVPNKYISWVVQRDPNVFMTTHHPVFHTYLLGSSLSIGRFILNDNFGLFIYTIIQTLVLSSTLAYTIKFAKNNKVSDKLRLILLFIYILVPMFPFYSISANKDTLYTYAGIGDLLLTATSNESRTFSYGESLANGIVNDKLTTVEGIKTYKSLIALIPKEELKDTLLNTLFVSYTEFGDLDSGSLI